MKVIIACRHGEALKNLKNIYGGNGSALTNRGVKQVEELASNIAKVVEYLQFPVQIYQSCDRIHVQESAEILRKKLGVTEIQKDPEFKPIRLGVFDGMSREKQLELYPEACQAHQAWEAGLIDITESERLVEGAQPALEYYEQVKGFLDRLPDKGIYILFGTRSDNMCLYNIFKGQSPAEYKRYQYYDFDYAESKILLERDGQTQMWETEELLASIDNLTKNNNQNPIAASKKDKDSKSCVFDFD
ncbi:MAG: histidine phosphatase family protein [Clostridia bacterium]|nr:histidine phosphatase family protein [Clostridia bacterium]